MADFVPQVIQDAIDVPVEDSTQMYISVDADTDVTANDGVPLILTDNLALTPSGEATTITTQDGVQLAVKGDTTWNSMDIATSAPDDDTVVANLIAAAKAKGADAVRRFNIFYKNGGGYDVGYLVVNNFRRTGQRPGTGQNIHQHIFNVTPFKVTQLTSSEAATS